MKKYQRKPRKTVLNIGRKQKVTIFVLSPLKTAVFCFQGMSYCLAGFLKHFVYSLLGNVKVPGLPGRKVLLKTFHHQGLFVW